MTVKYQFVECDHKLFAEYVDVKCIAALRFKTLYFFSSWKKTASKKPIIMLQNVYNSRFPDFEVNGVTMKVFGDPFIISRNFLIVLKNF